MLRKVLKYVLMKRSWSPKTVRICPGQLSSSTRLPSQAPSCMWPSLSTMAGLTPKNGSVADPGFKAVAPGSGVINMPPVSVCHQVSTMGHRWSPTTR